MPFDNKTDPLSLLDDEDDMSPEDEAMGMVIPNSLRLQESTPAALDNPGVKRGVLVRLIKILLFTRTVPYGLSAHQVALCL